MGDELNFNGATVIPYGNHRNLSKRILWHVTELPPMKSYRGGCFFKLYSMPISESWTPGLFYLHYHDVIIGAIASRISSLTIVYSDADQRPVNSPHKWPVTRKMLPFDDVIMTYMRHSASMSKHIKRSLLTNYELQNNLSCWMFSWNPIVTNCMSHMILITFHLLKSSYISQYFFFWLLTQ